MQGEQDAVPKEDGHARVRVQALKLQWSAGELHMWCPRYNLILRRAQLMGAPYL